MSRTDARATPCVKMPLGLYLPVGATHGVGTARLLFGLSSGASLRRDLGGSKTKMH